MFKHVKRIIKPFIPPIGTTLYRKIKPRHMTMFSGVYHKVSECPDQNPWVQSMWVEASQSKLNKIKAQELEFSGYITLPCLMTNLVSSRQTCRLLDFGGGTGFIYFRMFPHLLNSANVQWHVVDCNEPLLEMGKEFARDHNGYHIQFHTHLLKTGENQFDIVYLNTVLQYIDEYEKVLRNLLAFNPRYVILTRLSAGDIKTFVTCQNLGGHKSPYIFVNFDELVQIFEDNGYKLVFKAPEAEESFAHTYDRNIPSSLQIPYTMNVIFCRKEKEA
jgi:putative methyltransferase (TIGR04325 family)